MAIDWDQVNSILNKRKPKEEEFDAKAFLDDVMSNYNVLESYGVSTLDSIEEFYKSADMSLSDMPLTLKKLMEG